MATDDLIAALQGVGRVDSEGSFSFDREKAREKLRTFQVAEPQRYVLHFIAVAALKGATRIEVLCDSDDLIVRFDGAAITTEDLEDLYNASFAAAHSDEQRARQQLAIGIHAALALNPRHVRVVSGTEEGGVSLLARHDAADVVGPADPGGGTQIHVKQRFRPGLMVRFIRHLRGDLAEATWLRARGLHATLPITLNGRAISVGLTLAGAEHCKPGANGPARGVAGLLPGRAQGVIRLVRHGVWICDESSPWMPLGMVAVIADDLLLTDLSGDKVVLDEEHARCLALARVLAAEVVAAAVGPGVAVELDATLHDRLVDVWRQWYGALNPWTTLGAAMTRVVAWPDIWGRRHSFAALLAEAQRVGGLPSTEADLGKLLPVTDEIIVRTGDKLLDEVLALGLAGLVRDATAELEQRVRAESNRKRWRAQPCEPTLTAANYLMLADFSVQVGERRVQGQAGLRRVPGERCHLRAIVDGCALTEFELDAPIAGVDVVISGPLAVLADFSGLERDALFAAALAGWTATARVIVDAAVRRGVLDWPPEPAAQALVHGFVRAHRPAEALRSVLAGAGYDEAAQAQHLQVLLASMPTVPLADDLCEQRWIRDSVGFMTATGPRLSLGAVVVALSQAMAVECVSDQHAAHSGLKGLVLRVTPGERELLDGLFGARIVSIPDAEYERRLAEANFQARSPQPFMLELDAHTTSVIVDHEGLRVAMALPRTLEGWEANQVRSTCEVYYSSRVITQVKIWSPVPGVSFAIVGDALTPRPDWDGVRLDDAFYAATAKAAAAVPALVRAAISGVRENMFDDELTCSRGVLAALVASFPSPTLRAAYVHLLATKGPKPAEKHYLDLLALAAASSVHTVSRVLADNTTNLGVLMDVRQLAARVSVRRPSPEQVQQVADVLGEIRALLGQVGGDSWVHHVGNFSAEVDDLPLFRRVGRGVITLAEAAKEARTEKLHVYIDTGGRPSHAHAHSLRADPLTFQQLGCLFGSAYLSTAARRGAATGEPRPARKAAPRRHEPARPKPAVEEDPPPSAEDLASLFAELQREADRQSPACPVKPAPAAAKVSQSTPPPPGPGERLVAAVQAELEALRRGHESLLTGFNLDHVRAVAGGGTAMVSITRDGLVIDLEHPLVKRALDRHAGDRLWISFLASRIYTALNVWREDITDVDEAAFHARHLAWLDRER